MDDTAETEQELLSTSTIIVTILVTPKSRLVDWLLYFVFILTSFLGVCATNFRRGYILKTTCSAAKRHW